MIYSDIDPSNKGSLDYDEFSKNVSRHIKLSNPKLYVIYKYSCEKDKLSMKKLFKNLGGAWSSIIIYLLITSHLISFELFLNNGTSSELCTANGRIRFLQHSEVSSQSLRNQMLQDKNVIQAMSHKKTGTTIVGCKYRDGVVLAADTRATGGSIVVEKNC